MTTTVHLPDAQAFDATRPGETVFLQFDFTNDLGAATLSTVVSVTSEVYSWSPGIDPDPSPSAILSGSPTNVGSIVQQKVTSLRDDTNYYLLATITDSLGRTLSLPGVLPVGKR